MPFKSQAQRRKFAELLVEGKITAEQFEEWNRETGDAVLPERAAPAKKKTASKKKKPTTAKKRVARKQSPAKKKASSKKTVKKR